ncbi:hypothetical protein DPMN_123397 [Dreissena polymorpha]|uniref:Uncharacterized protein n=1 Tax=Dreissena polymorpha TaxID=45954 RepID=A0A9D4JVB5_DREPO|nr:hypothetical protein DPMN_123397 [Dreissena polymorpha]
MNEVATELTEEFRSALLGVHAYCGCDTTSAFKEKGHIKPIKLMEKMPRTVAPIAALEITCTVADEVVDELDIFTCVMYGNSRTDSVDKLRFPKKRRSVMIAQMRQRM